MMGRRSGGGSFTILYVVEKVSEEEQGMNE